MNTGYGGDAKYGVTCLKSSLSLFPLYIILHLPETFNHSWDSLSILVPISSNQMDCVCNAFIQCLLVDCGS